MVLNSKFFGVPQNRERVFIIGNLRGQRRPEILPLGEDTGEVDKFHEKRLQCIYEGNFQSKRVYNSEGLSPTIPTACGGQHIPFIAGCLDSNYHKGDNRINQKSNRTKIIQDMKIRRLTPTECERLQGFPDGWTEGLSDTQRYKQLGNAVTTNVIESIIKRINETCMV